MQLLTQNLAAQLARINGLRYEPLFLTPEEHIYLWQSIQQSEWLGDLKRRVQHYGYKYDYKARHIDYSMKIGDLPDWVQPLATRLFDAGVMPQVPDQLIINEYEAGQGIASHVDCAPCFGDTIVSISLGSACVMDFTHRQTQEKINVLLEPRSMVVMQQEARYDWTHGIVGRKSDVFNGQKLQRHTRISLTFRNVIIR